MRLVSLLLPVLLLAACAPSATTTEAQGPLTSGERWTISGADQNNRAMNGSVTVPADPFYDRTDREWVYRSAGARIYFDETSGEFQVWDTTQADRLLICMVRAPYRYVASQKEFVGVSVAGSLADINAVFAKLSGSGTRLVGGDCTVTRQ